MIERIGDRTVKLLGDPHLGKSFLNGTPLHRRGDREKMQWADFEASLNEVAGVDVHVCMGDLFDKWTVPYDVIFRAAQAYNKAATENSDVEYFVAQGNHDASRDLERVSAFRLFDQMIHARNVHVVASVPLNLSVSMGGSQYIGHTRWEGEKTVFVFIPWDAVSTAAEMVEEYAEAIRGADCVFGHWDVVTAFQSDNLIPAKRLVELGVKRAITGHDHNKRSLVIDDLPVMITGSLQPYSFGEDPDQRLYLTMSLLAAQHIRPELVRNKCVRVLLMKDETLDFAIDCLQLKTQRIGEADEDDAPLNVEFGGFDFEKLFGDVMTELKVDPAFGSAALARYDAERAKQ